MNTMFRALLVVAVASLAACSKDAKCPKPLGTGLPGTWKLEHRQCYCAPAPTPNETLVLTPTDFSFFANGQLQSSGTYALATVTACGLPAPGPGLRLTRTQPATGPAQVTYTLAGNQLTLDYGSPCDAARDTYERIY